MQGDRHGKLTRKRGRSPPDEGEEKKIEWKRSYIIKYQVVLLLEATQTIKL